MCFLTAYADENKIDKIRTELETIAQRTEREGKIDSAAMARREKISVLSRAQLDSLVIIEAPKEMQWMEQHH